MKLNVTVELEDFFDPNEMTLEEVLSAEIKKAIVKDISDKFSEKGMKELSYLLSEQVEEQISSCMQKKAMSFMADEIALTDRWGKPTFIGTIEDFMRMKFDEAILFPVDRNGKKLQGCAASDTPNWLQWSINQGVTDKVNGKIRDAQRETHRFIEKTVGEELEKHKAVTVKAEISKALEGLLKPNTVA